MKRVSVYVHQIKLFVTIDNVGNEDKCRYECKELIDKSVCDKEFFWNPSNCEYECDKSCNIG